MASSTPFMAAIKARRTHYALHKNIPLSSKEVVKIVEEAMQAVPTSFNSQSNRAVVLLGTEHDKLWDIVGEVLKARVSEEHWVSTDEKMQGFKGAGGTILFFVDTAVVEKYAADIPNYAAEFPVWAAQADAMLQHTTWTALATEDVGANLQHYNPLIDARVTETWDLPATWRLTSQLVFGGKVSGELAPMEKKPVAEKSKVFGM